MTLLNDRPVATGPDPDGMTTAPTCQSPGRFSACPWNTIPLRIFAAVSGFASASSNMRVPSPVKRRAMVKGVSFG